MFFEYHPPVSVIDETIGRMKKARIIHQDAKLNLKAENNLRKEITFSDIDFMDFLAKTSLEEECVDGALNLLKKKGLISSTKYLRSFCISSVPASKAFSIISAIYFKLFFPSI